MEQKDNRTAEPDRSREDYHEHVITQLEEQTAALREELQSQRTGFLREADGLKEYIKQLTEELQSLREENERVIDALKDSEELFQWFDLKGGLGLREHDLIRTLLTRLKAITSNKE